MNVVDPLLKELRERVYFKEVYIAIKRQETQYYVELRLKYAKKQAGEVLRPYARGLEDDYKLTKAHLFQANNGKHYFWNSLQNIFYKNINICIFFFQLGCC